jgi:hypothetical protein
MTLNVPHHQSVSQSVFSSVKWGDNYFFMIWLWGSKEIKSIKYLEQDLVAKNKKTNYSSVCHLHCHLHCCPHFSTPLLLAYSPLGFWSNFQGASGILALCFPWAVWKPVYVYADSWHLLSACCVPGPELRPLCALYSYEVDAVIIILLFH